MNLNWKTMDSFVWPRMFWDERAFRLLLKKQLEGAESIMVEELPVETRGECFRRVSTPLIQLLSVGLNLLATGSRDECCKHCSHGTD